MTVKESHDKFVERIGLYNGFLSQTAFHFDDILRRQKYDAEVRNLPNFVMPILGSKLLYRNPITVKYEFAYNHSINEDNLEESLLHLKVNYFNFVIAQCFEAFESYLKDIVAAYLVCKQDVKIDLDPVIDRSDFKKCRETLLKYCSSKNKYNRKMFDILYVIDLRIQNIEKDNLLLFDFKEWNLVFTEVRHCIVHSNSQFKMNKSNGWSTFQKEVLNKLFMEKIEDGIGCISTVVDYDYILRVIAQHGQIIFDCLKDE